MKFQTHESTNMIIKRPKKQIKKHNTPAFWDHMSQGFAQIGTKFETTIA
jgi:hypothetical protein